MKNIPERKNIAELKPYESARGLYKRGLLLDANENYQQWMNVDLSKMKNLNRYPDPNCDALRDKLAQIYTKRLSKENIFIGNGSDEIISLLIEGFVERDESVMLMEPSYGVYEVQAGIKNRKIKKIILNSDFSLNINEIKKQCKGTKLLFLCSPNNPTGNLITFQEIQQIIQFFTGIVVIDEAYIEYAGLENSFASLVKTNKQIVVLRTFSKAWGLAGVRVGYALGDPVIINTLNKIKPSYNVSSISQEIVSQALDQKSGLQKSITQTKDLKKQLERDLTVLGMPIIPTQTNFVLAKIPNAKKIYQQLAQQKIIVRDRSTLPYLGDALRITVGSETENKKFLQALRPLIFDALIWDMDGVLIDVSRSYRRTILETVRYFCPKETISIENVNRIKNTSGFNNDWDTTYQLIEQRTKNKINYEQVKTIFQKKYKLLSINEKLLIPRDVLKQLKNRYRKFGIATGRPRNEALAALQKNGITDLFDTVVALEDTVKGKPDPQPLFKAARNLSVVNPLYIGDTPSDRQAAQAAQMRYLDIGSSKKIERVL